MSGYEGRPSLGLYRDQPADYAVEFDNALAMFRSGVAKDPGAVALQYFDGNMTRRGPTSDSSPGGRGIGTSAPPSRRVPHPPPGGRTAAGAARP